MAGLFGGPKVPKALPVVNPADSANQVNTALAAKLASGGTNADQTSAANTFAPVGAMPVGRLTGLN